MAAVGSRAAPSVHDAMAGFPAGRDARLEHRGVYSAWLMKEDADRDASRWFQPSCRRYVTIDFDSRVIFYSHSEIDKYSSDPIPFKEILWASMAETEACASSGTKIAKQQRPVFIVETCQWRTRLVSESVEDANRWVDSLNAARLIGQQAESNCKMGLVGIFRASWDADRGTPKRQTSSVASMSTADGSISSSSSSSSASRSMPTALSPLVSSVESFSRGTDEAEADSDILDVLLKELQDIEDNPYTPSESAWLSGSQSIHRTAPSSGCDSPRLDVSFDANPLDLDVLEVLLHSLGAQDVKPTDEAAALSLSAPDSCAKWATPGGLGLHEAASGRKYDGSLRYFPVNCPVRFQHPL